MLLSQYSGATINNLHGEPLDTGDPNCRCISLLLQTTKGSVLEHVFTRPYAQGRQATYRGKP